MFGLVKPLFELEALQKLVRLEFFDAILLHGAKFAFKVLELGHGTRHGMKVICVNREESRTCTR